MMINEIEILKEENKNNALTVRVKTSYWVDKSSIHTKKSITTLKRKTSGHDFLIQDSIDIGVEDVFHKIVNLHYCDDGVYEVITCNESRDRETNCVEDWDYKLVDTSNEKNN